MMMIHFNIRDFPRFYEEFDKEMRTITPYYSPLRSMLAETIFKKRFDLTVMITSCDPFGVVSMDEKDFTMFVLKWKWK